MSNLPPLLVNNHNCLDTTMKKKRTKSIGCTVCSLYRVTNISSTWVMLEKSAVAVAVSYFLHKLSCYNHLYGRTLPTMQRDSFVSILELSCILINGCSTQQKRHRRFTLSFFHTFECTHSYLILLIWLSSRMCCCIRGTRCRLYTHWLEQVDCYIYVPNDMPFLSYPPST